MIAELDLAERAVIQVFHDELPASSVDEWGLEVDDQVAQNIINGVGRASRIDVAKFIEDLW